MKLPSQHIPHALQSPKSHEIPPTNISCFSFHTYHMHTNIQSNEIIAYYITTLSFESHSGIHTKHGHILWAKEIINTSIESHQPTQQPLSQILAQAEGPRPGERVSFAQATPSRLGESATVATARFQRVLAQATASRLSEIAPRSKFKTSHLGDNTS